MGSQSRVSSLLYHDIYAKAGVSNVQHCCFCFSHSINFPRLSLAFHRLNTTRGLVARRQLHCLQGKDKSSLFKGPCDRGFQVGSQPLRSCFSWPVNSLHVPSIYTLVCLMNPLITTHRQSVLDRPTTPCQPPQPCNPHPHFLSSGCNAYTPANPSFFPHRFHNSAF